jgi:hypothetical protein
MSHLWQRFMLATALVFGLALGVAATVFGYSNTAPVNIGFAVVHLSGVPLWTVGVVPFALLLAAGTLYHWLNSVHHFTEHMRHRRRVHELEAEVASLKAHLDKLLEVPDGTGTAVGAAPAPVETELSGGPDGAGEEEAPTVPALSTNGGARSSARKTKRASLASAFAPAVVDAAEPATATLPRNGEDATEEPADPAV